MPARLSEFPLSRRNLQRFTQRGPRFDYLELLAIRDFQYTVYDFLEQAIDTTNLWTVASGATATTWAVRAEAGGWARGVTGTTAATSGLQISNLQKYHVPSSNPGVMFLWRTNSVSEIRVEMGFADALPAVNTPIIPTIGSAGFTTTAAGAIYAFDHATATTTSGLFTDGSAVAAQRAAFTTGRPAVDTLHMVMIQIIGQNCFVITGDGVQPNAVLSAAITVTDGLRPVFAVKKSDTSSANVDLDAIVTWGSRLAQTGGYS